MNNYTNSAKWSRELLNVIWDRYDNTSKEEKAERVLQYLYERKARGVIKRYPSSAYADVMSM